MLRKLGTRFYRGELKDGFMRCDDKYCVELFDCGNSAILIESVEQIEELEFLLKEMKERWGEKLN